MQKNGLENMEWNVLNSKNLAIREASLKKAVQSPERIDALIELLRISKTVGFELSIVQAPIAEMIRVEIDLIHLIRSSVETKSAHVEAQCNKEVRSRDKESLTFAELSSNSFMRSWVPKSGTLPDSPKTVLDILDMLEIVWINFLKQLREITSVEFIARENRNIQLAEKRIASIVSDAKTEQVRLYRSLEIAAEEYRLRERKMLLPNVWKGHTNGLKNILAEVERLRKSEPSKEKAPDFHDQSVISHTHRPSPRKQRQRVASSARTKSAKTRPKKRQLSGSSETIRSLLETFFNLSKEFNRRK